MVILNSLNDKSLIKLINSGAIGVLPTDTIYGLTCQAKNKQSVINLYKMKKRLGQKAGTVIASSVNQLIDLGVTRRYLKAVEQFWPNPISVIIPVSKDLSYLTQGLDSLALRVVDDKKLAELLDNVGPLLTSSANRTSQPPATNIAEAQKYFGDRIDFYVDGGDLSGRQPSTIISIIDDAIELVRAGAVNIDETGKIMS